MSDSSPRPARMPPLELRMERHGDEDAPCTLPESAVVSKLVHALESPRPKARYHVTVPTHALAFLKRVLPGRWLDAALHGISDSELRGVSGERNR